MEQLVQQFMDRYLTREQIAYRLPISIPVTRFWPEMEKARKAASVQLPLKTQNEEPFWFVINSSIEEHCDAVAAMARRSHLLEGLPQQMIEEATIDEAVWSSVIEGAFTSKAEAAKIIRQDKAPRNKSEQMIKNNYQALLYVLQHLQDPITAETLIDIAKIVTRDASDEKVEGFRTVPVYVMGPSGVVYTPPDATQVPALMNDLLSFINHCELHPLLKASIAHFYFVYVHPFTDGNGRSARALSLMMLLRTGYDFFRFFSISGIIAQERNGYYRSMRNVENSAGDMTYFVDFYSAMLDRSVKKIEQHLVNRVLADKMLKQLQKDGKLNPRQVKGVRWIIEKSMDHITVEDWKKKFKVVTETARQDLLLICDEGILEKTMDGRKAVFIRKHDQ